MQFTFCSTFDERTTFQTWQWVPISMSLIWYCVDIFVIGGSMMHVHRDRRPTICESRRAAERTSARKPSPPRPRRLQRARSERTQRNSIFIGRRVPPFAAAFHLLSSPPHSRAWPFAVTRATQFRRRKHCRPTGTGEPPLPSGSGYSAAAEKPAPSMTLPPTSLIAACHRVVLRGTHSPVNRRATRATQPRAARAGS